MAAPRPAPCVMPHFAKMHSIAPGSLGGALPNGSKIYTRAITLESFFDVEE